ncbi:MAG: hypothetical protein ACI9DJ_001558 [Algoriphagus sp.]
MHRPVDFKKTDFDSDGFEDILISTYAFKKTPSRSIGEKVVAVLKKKL